MDHRRKAGLMLLALAMPVLGPVLADRQLHRDTIGKQSISRIFWVLLHVQVTAIAVFIIMALWQIWVLNKFRYNVRIIQLAINRWQFDHNFASVPENLDDLITAGYLTRLPTNPFTGTSIRAIRLDYEPHFGDITYLPIFRFPANEGDFSGDFALLGYGPSWLRTGNIKCLHISENVVIALTTGFSTFRVDTDRDGQIDKRRCVGGISCEEVIQIYRGEKQLGWMTASDYHKLRAK
jgi:hypothetical protein